MTRDQAIDLARSAAVARPDGHKYIPSGKLTDWHPHEWVVDAILAASRCALPEQAPEPICPACKGSGEVGRQDTTRGPDGDTYSAECPNCGGTGALPEQAGGALTMWERECEKAPGWLREDGTKGLSFDQAALIRIGAALARAPAAGGALTEAQASCPYGDKSCPCPDGDSCHYEGKDAWSATPPALKAAANALATVLALYFQATASGSRVQFDRADLIRWKAWALDVANEQRDDNEDCASAINRAIAALTTARASTTADVRDATAEALKAKFFELCATGAEIGYRSPDFWHLMADAAIAKDAP